MNVSRRRKNTFLLLSNGLLFFLKLTKLAVQALNPTEIYWMMGFGLIITFFSLPLKKAHKIFQDISLFLLSGWAIGITLGALISETALLLPEKLWIPFALVVAFIHYSPSNLDKYSSL